MTHQNIDYFQVLRSHGYRVTPQRITILDAICEGKGHSTLGAIYARARKQDIQIDMSTVYRAVEVFQALGLVVSVDFDGHEKGYEIAKPEPHHHLICKKCRREFDIEGRIVNDFYELLRKNYGYDVTMDHLVLTGLCPECQWKLKTLKA
ncbi:MAG: Fur family transcriptional regulator [Anaerolineales bacterium]